MAETRITVRSDLLKIAEDLRAIAAQATAMSGAIKEGTTEVGKEVENQTSLVTAWLKKMRGLNKGVAKEMAEDFKSLFQVNALASGLKLNEQFRGAIKEAVTLNDTVRALAPIFGMTQARGEAFKRGLVRDLADIGVSSEAAANALQGLAQTKVRGDSNLSAYARTASEVAGISKQRGQEGTIAQGLARVVVAQGGDVNDPKAMQKVAEDIVRIRNATGKTATEALTMLEKLFSAANTDFKGRLGRGGGTSLAAAGLVGGEGSTAFLERFMGMSPQARAGFEAQGLGNLVGGNGQLNSKGFESTISEARRRSGGNAEFGLQTMGMTEEEAKGFLRLAQAMRENSAAIERARTSTVDLNAEYRQTMGLGDAFRANINRLKGSVSSALPDILNPLTQGLSDASKSTAGSAAVVGGGAVLAAVLTGGGIRGILGGELKKRAVEGLTGEKVQRVEVINWPTSMAGAWSPWGGAATAAGGAAAGLGTAAKGGLYGLAAGGGVAAGLGLENLYERSREKDAPSSLKALHGTPIFAMLDILNVGLERLFRHQGDKGIVQAKTHDVRVTVDTKDKSLKAYPHGSRGVAQ